MVDFVFEEFACFIPYNCPSVHSFLNPSDPMIMLTRISLRYLLLGTILCCFNHTQRTDAAPAQQVSSGAIAAEVTIYRDVYGVAHVFGRTDASTVFGFAYAQAEDNFWQIEDNYIRALGRSSEIYGDATLGGDRLNHALEIPRLAREEYGRLDSHTRSLCNAYAAGLNYYLKRHAEAKPRLLARIEPWYPLAFIRYNYYQNGFAQDPAIDLRNIQTAETERGMKANQGSNGWVIGPSKSATARWCAG